MSELLIGCGANRDKRLNGSDWGNLVTLDFNKDVNPDIVHDLNILPYPFKDNEFEEIHAYEVLEHLGRQGDFKFFFAQFEELWRILKPNGVLCATCPNWDNIWAWGDPGHTRIISPASLTFLSQKQYQEQCGKTSMTDYRFCYKADFELLGINYHEANFSFALRAIK